MEPITIAVRALKRALNEITISPGKIYVDYNDIIDFEDPVAQHAWDMQYKEPEIVEANDYIINHKAHRGVSSNAFAEEFQKVRDEYTDNVKVLGISGIADYLDDILKFYGILQSKIKENDDGSFSSDIVTFDGCNAEEVNNSMFKNSYNDFLEGLKRALRKEIVFFSMQKVSDITETPNKSKEVGPRSQKQRYNSLRLVVNKQTDFDEVLREFHKALKDYGLIESMDYRLFRKVFVNEHIDKQIRWIGEPNELKYLIKSLRENKLIKPLIGFWPLTCKCFVIMGNPDKVLEPDYLAKCNTPNRTKRKEIDSIINLLVN
jgi:hypothetical protein